MIQTKSATMEKKRLEHFKKRLVQKQTELLQAVSRNEQDGRAADEEATQDVADKAINSYTKEFLFHLSNSDRNLLQMVAEALQRIKDGTYGQCASCGNDMNPKRLEAVPWARHCLNCQERVEQGVH
ncbi:MAG: TraR/DksA family transcriptional regulator [Terriglobales bacterium]